MEDSKISLTPEADAYVMPEPGPERIGFGLRLGAYLIDAVIVFMLGTLFSNLFPSFVESLLDFTKVNEMPEGTMKTFTETMMTIGVGSTILGFVYNLTEAVLGYTLGKMILGLQVGNSDGTRASIETYALRFAIKNISSFFAIMAYVPALLFMQSIGSALGFVIVVGCFFVLGEKRQSFHDMLAKTAVFKRAEIK